MDMFGPLLTVAEHMPLLRAIVAGVLVFFLPGFAWTLVFFGRVNIIERVALSIGLSIALVTLGIIVLNVFLGMPINGVSSLLFIIAVTAIGFAVYLLRRYAFRPTEPSDGD